MNNKGVITRGMAILAALILIIVLAIVIIINVGKSTNVNKYKSFEKELVTGAQNYYVIKNLDIDEGEEKKITLKTYWPANIPFFIIIFCGFNTYIKYVATPPKINVMVM